MNGCTQNKTILSNKSLMVDTNIKLFLCIILSVFPLRGTHQYAGFYSCIMEQGKYAADMSGRKRQSNERSSTKDHHVLCEKLKIRSVNRGSFANVTNVKAVPSNEHFYIVKIGVVSETPKI